MTAIPLGSALWLGLRALWREPWLAAVGLLVTILRRALGWPALLVALLLAVRGAQVGVQLAPASPAAPVVGALLVLAQPRTLALLAGLWGAGLLLGFAARLAWLAGALPTLAGALGPAPDRTPRFATGLVGGLPRLVATSILGLVVEAIGGIFAATMVLGSIRISLAEARLDRPAALAAAVAVALSLAVIVPILCSLLADIALVRSGVREEGPARAVASAAARLAERPAAFLLAALLFGAAGLATAISLASVGQLAAGATAEAGPLLAAGPRLMLGAAGATVAACLELWWLAALTALAGD